MDKETDIRSVTKWGLLCWICLVVGTWFFYNSIRTSPLEICEMCAIISAKDISGNNNVKGVRDFVWVVDATDILKPLEGREGYFNVFFQDEMGPCIYRGRYTNGKYEVEPISLARDVGVDEFGISIGSVIYRNGVYQLFYSGLTANTGTPRWYTFNTAFSDDGLNFSGKKTLLTNDDFCESMHIGLPYTIAIEEDASRFLMVCEGINLNTKEYCVYGAYGNDNSFSVINGGRPILTSKEIPWSLKVGGVANPKLKTGKNGKYYMGFNASDLGENKSAWRLGTATFFFKEGEVTDIRVNEPIVVPSWGGGDMKRIESAEILYDTELNPLEITFFATPTYDATIGATIYRGVFKNNHR